MRIAVASLMGLMVASGVAPAAESYRFGSRVLTVGDTAGELIELAGAPVHKAQVENKFGALEAERWEYRQEGKTLLVTVKDGKVAQIDEIY